MTHVYFAHLGDYLKVGRSRDTEERVAWLRYSGGGNLLRPLDLQLRSAPLHSLHSFEADFRLERTAQDALAAANACGEWFFPDAVPFVNEDGQVDSTALEAWFESLADA